MKFYNNISKRFLVLLSAALVLTDGSFAYPLVARAEEVIEEPEIEIVPEGSDKLDEIEEEIIEMPDETGTIVEPELIDETVPVDETAEQELSDDIEADEEILDDEADRPDEDLADGDEHINVTGVCDYIASAGGFDFKNNSTVIGQLKLDISSWSEAGDMAKGKATCTSAIGTSEAIGGVIRVPRYVLLHSEVSKETLSENNAYKVRHAMHEMLKALKDGNPNPIDDSANAMFWDGSGRGSGKANFEAKKEFVDNLRIYDFTNSSVLIDGYETTLDIDTQKQVIKGYDPSNPDDYSDCNYVGEVFEITELANTVFMDDKCQMAQIIRIPMSIKSDITVEYFERCTAAKRVDVYFQSEDNFNNSTYYSGPYKDFNLTGLGDNVLDASTTGVLLKKNPESGISYKVIFCPPKYEAATYYFPFAAGNSTPYVIGPRAFYNCTALTKIGWQSNSSRQSATITRISEEAFYNCKSLISADIFDNGLRLIDDRAFYNCEALGSVGSADYYFDHTIHLNPGTNARIGKEAFANTSIQTLNIPVGYSDINGESLKGMNLLEKITVDTEYNEITKIEKSKNSIFMATDGILYRKNPDITDKDEARDLVCFPSAKVQENNELPELPYKSDYDGFENNTFMVPESVTAIDGYAFNNCGSIYNLILLSTIYSISENSVYSCPNLRNVYSHSGLPDISYEAGTDYFKNCANPKSELTIHAAKYFDDGVKSGIYNCAKDMHYTVEPLLDISKFTFRESNGEYTLTGMDSAVRGDVFIPDFVIKDGKKYYVTSVSGNGIFALNDQITSVTLLRHLANISSDAFLIVDKDNRDDVSKDTVSDLLEAIYVEPGNKNFIAYEGALYKRELNETTGEYYISELIYYPPSNPQEVYTTFPTLLKLPRYAFRGAKYLKSINIYDYIKAIGEYTAEDGQTLCDEPATFAGCTSLVEINIIPSDPPIENKRDIKYASGKEFNGHSDGVLYRCRDGELYNLVFYPQGPRDWYDNGHNAVAYEVEDGCKIITYAKDIKTLVSVEIPKSVTTILPEAFAGTENLRSVNFKTVGKETDLGIQTIGEKAFATSGIENLSIPNTIMNVGDGAFYDCSALKHVVINVDKLSNLGDSAFANCESLDTVRLVTSDVDNPKLSGPILEIGERCFRNDTSLTSFTLKKVKSVKLGDSVFEYNSNMSECNIIQTPVSLLGSRCFAYCSKLESIDLSVEGGVPSFTVVENSAFFGCKKLKKVVLPTSVDRIKDQAFRNCNNLSSFNFAKLTRLTRIEKQAFQNCNFKQVGFDENSSLTKIGDMAFAGNKNLVAIYIPSTVTYFDTITIDSELTTKTIVYTAKGSPVANYIFSINGIDYDGDNPIIELQPYYELESYKGPRVSYGEIPKFTIHITLDDATPMYTQNIGSTRQVIARIECSQPGVDFDPEAIAYVSEAPDVLSVDENTGLVTLVGGVAGKYDITAYSVVGGQEASVTIDVETAAIYIDGVDTDSAHINVNAKKGEAYINATSNPTRSLYYEVVDGKSYCKVDANGKIIGKKMGRAKIKVYAKEGDGAAYDTYMDNFVIVNVLEPKLSIPAKSKKIIIYGDHTESEINRDDWIKASANDDKDGGSQVANTDYSYTTVYVNAYSLGPDKKTRSYCVDNKVEWSLPNTSNVYMLDAEGKRVNKLTTVVGDGDNAETEASVKLYAAANVNKKVKLVAKYNGVKKNITVNVRKITTAIRPGVVDIYDAGKPGRLKAKITGPDKKNLKWEFLNADGSSESYIESIDKKGVLKVAPHAFTGTNKDKKVYVFLTANGVRSDPCEVNIRKATTKIVPPGDNIVTVEGVDYIHLNSAGNNKLSISVQIEGPDVKKVKWESSDKESMTVKGKGGMAKITGIDSGKPMLYATANGVTAEYPVKVVDTYTRFADGAGKELDLNKQINDGNPNAYKPNDMTNKLRLQIKGTDAKAKVEWSSSNEKICKINAIDGAIEGQSKSAFFISQDDTTSKSDFGYKRLSMVELNPQKKGSCYIIAKANGVTAKYKIVVY